MGRARRGQVRAALLALLAERPWYGNEMITELGERTCGGWRPSPGSVYPTLQVLTDEGLIVERTVAGRRGFALTETGRAAAAAGPSTPWAGHRPCPGIPDGGIPDGGGPSGSGGSPSGGGGGPSAGGGSSGGGPEASVTGNADSLVRWSAEQLLDAVAHVLLAGAETDKQRAAQVLTEARRTLYRLLAAEPGDRARTAEGAEG